MAPHSFELLYFFDPLCGWCYASAPALAGLAERHGTALRMMPVGLFMQPRPVATIAEHAWHNDQRIVALTGQRFTEAYRSRVLLAADGVFDSTPLTRALVALGALDTALEPQLLHVAQLARYVDGMDTCTVDAVSRIAADVAASAGHGLDADELAARLRDDRVLAENTARRVAAARQAMPAGGVPQLLLRADGVNQVIAGQDLYTGPQRLLARIASLL